MEPRGLTFLIDPLDTQGATIKFGGDATGVVRAFQDELGRRLQRKGLVVLTPGVDPHNAHVRITARVVRIDEGNRLLRYLLTFLAGHAVFEVEAHVALMGTLLVGYHHASRQGVGIFGGASEVLLVAAATASAGRLAGQVLRALKTRQV